MKFLMTLAFVMFSSLSFADQCAWNSETDAKSAAALLKGKDLIFWCQNCDDRAPSKIFKIDAVQTARVGQTYREVRVKLGTDFQDIDLAYTYVRTASDIFVNVAQAVGCPSEGATTFIQTGPGVKKQAHYYDAKGVRKNVKTINKEVPLREACL